MINIKMIQKLFQLILLTGYSFSIDISPISQRYFHSGDDNTFSYSRGTYLIVLADESLRSILEDESTGDFIHFKKTQGYDVEIVNMNEIATSGDLKEKLRKYLEYYYQNNSMLEYVLLIGDVDGNYSIPGYYVASYSYDEIDITDHYYTFFDEDPLTPNFFIGRWSIRNEDELEKIKIRSIGYVTMKFPGSDYSLDPSYLNNALMVAASYGGDGIYPVTPVWTSQWLMDELHYNGYAKVDTAFWQKGDVPGDNTTISNAWNEGVGLIGYRGWGGGTGWAFPDFRNPDLENLINVWKLPVVFSFVCNTGDYARSGGDHCFAEKAITCGTVNSPTGAVAAIGPSDKDTDTKFNNPMYGTVMDVLLEKKVLELGPALHAGKQCLISEFGKLRAPDLYNFEGSYAEFYHYVYNILGDPSLPVWLDEPKAMNVNLDEGSSISSSYVSVLVTDENSMPLSDVVGVIIDSGKLIGKGLSNINGELVVDFNTETSGSGLELYLNRSEYIQKKININYSTDDGVATPVIAYPEAVEQEEYLYSYSSSESNAIGALQYDWIEINEIGTNLNLTDDSLVPDLELGFTFNYYGQAFSKLTVCSNGWASFLPCLKSAESTEPCNPLPYFYNNSLTHAIGPYAMIAPFFDDLDDNEGTEPFNVYFWTNNLDSAIVEWHEVAQRRTDQFCPDNCEKETFQLILDNKGIDGGNGNIVFQYKEIYDIDKIEDHGATVGVEAPDKNSATQYLFNYSYGENADTLKNGLAIKFADRCGEPVPVSWCDCEGSKRDECGVCGGDGECYGCTVMLATNYDSNALIDDGSCILSLEHSLMPEEVSLNAFPNPFNPVSQISFSVPIISQVSIVIYSIRGEEVLSLSDQLYQPGYHSIDWNASNYASGLYIISMTLGDANISKKVLLLK